MNTEAGNLHARLREATHALHKDLEHAVGIDERISSRPRYIAYLTRLWSLHRAAEEALINFDFTPLGFDYRARRRSQFIESDLRDLGFELRAPVGLRQIKPPALGSMEAGLGCIYVIEGSALGARAILPQIEAHLGLTPQYGASFFVGFGDEGKLLWRAFLKAINAIDGASPSAQRVIEAAEQTFRFFHSWLPERPIEITSSAVA
jgi:heme oxygenase (biliverdin-IX-beta and delta-forming)